MSLFRTLWERTLVADGSEAESWATGCCPKIIGYRELFFLEYDCSAVLVRVRCSARISYVWTQMPPRSDLPPKPVTPRLQLATERPTELWASQPLPASSPSPRGGGDGSTPLSRLVPSPSPHVRASVLWVRVSISALQTVSAAPVFQVPHVCTSIGHSFVSLWLTSLRGQTPGPSASPQMAQACSSLPRALLPRWERPPAAALSCSLQQLPIAK